MTKTIENLLLRKQAIINYLNHKIKEDDWHAVSDAANDLRELEVTLLYESKTIGD
jgi:hypothetical protein